MGLPHSALCICASISSNGCWSTISISAVFWIWIRLERSHNTDLVRSAWSCCSGTFTVSEGKLFKSMLILLHLHYMFIN